MARLTWDEYFLEVAKAAAKRSACLSRSIGAVLVKDNRILSTGYNGPPAGHSHCVSCRRKTSGTELDKCPAVHAEQNAILYALKEFGDISGSTLYVVTQPCTQCCKIIATVGIKRVIYSEAYADNFGLTILAKAGVEYEKI